MTAKKDTGPTVEDRLARVEQYLAQNFGADLRSTEEKDAAAEAAEAEAAAPAETE